MKKQSGMTLIGMLVTMAIIVMAAIVVMRVIPVYFTHYSIVKSIKSLNTTPVASLSGDPLADAAMLRGDLSKRLEVNGVNDLKNSEVIIVPSGEHRFKVTLKYKETRFLVYNISLLFDFDDTYVVVTGSEN